MHLPHSVLGFGVSHSWLQFSLAAFTILFQQGSLWISTFTPLTTSRQARKRIVVFILYWFLQLSEVYIPSNQILFKLYWYCPDSKNFCFYRTNFLSKKHTSQLTAPQDKIVINVLSLYFSHYKIQSVQNYTSAYIGPNILQNSACLSMIMLLLLLKDYLDLSVWQQENK